MVGYFITSPGNVPFPSSPYRVRPQANPGRALQKPDQTWWLKKSHSASPWGHSAPSFARYVARHAVKRKQGNRWAGYGAPKIRIQGADVLSPAEGHMTRGASASPGAALRSLRPQTRLDTFCTRTVRFTALLHHLTVDLLRNGFYALKRKAAPGVDGVTWQEYQTGLEGRLTDLHGRVHRGAYRAHPSRRV